METKRGITPNHWTAWGIARRTRERPGGPAPRDNGRHQCQCLWRRELRCATSDHKLNPMQDRLKAHGAQHPSRTSCTSSLACFFSGPKRTQRSRSGSHALGLVHPFTERGSLHGGRIPGGRTARRPHPNPPQAPRHAAQRRREATKCSLRGTRAPISLPSTKLGRVGPAHPARPTQPPTSVPTVTQIIIEPNRSLLKRYPLFRQTSAGLWVALLV